MVIFLASNVSLVVWTVLIKVAYHKDTILSEALGKLDKPAGKIDFSC